jgi:hypothetical protein
VVVPRGRATATVGATERRVLRARPTRLLTPPSQLRSGGYGSQYKTPILCAEMGRSRERRDGHTDPPPDTIVLPEAASMSVMKPRDGLSCVQTGLPE